MISVSATQAIRERLKGLKTRGSHHHGRNELAGSVEAMELSPALNIPQDQREGPKADINRKLQAAVDAIGD